MKLDQNYIYANIKNAGGTWSAKHQAFRFPKSIFTLNELEKKDPQAAKTDVFKKIKQTVTEQREKLTKLKAQPPINQPNDKLRPYQRQDVQYLTQIPSAAILNQPRTGKTPTLIETIKAKGTKRNIIVTPASLQNNWIRELKTWHPEAAIYSGQKAIIKAQEHQTDVYYLVISKDTLKRIVNDFPAIDTLTVDEAHYLRNRATAQSKAVISLGKRAKHRYALTGTPTVKHPADIFGILTFLYPDKFSSYWQFVERYFQIHDNGFGKTLGAPIAHRADELKDLIDAISTQRLRKDVMQWLPNKQRHKHIITLDSKQNKVYKSMLDDFFTQDEDGRELDTQNVLTQLLRLRQITLDPALVGLNAPSAKTEAILDIIENNVYTDTNEPVIVMSMFTSYLNLLKPKIHAIGKRVGMITGQMTNKEKDDTAQAFQRGEIDVLLCNIISAGTGFTLDKGEVIIFTDKAWNPSDNEQAEDRVTPTKEENVHSHTIISLVCENTIDEHIESTLDKKENLTSIINQCKSVDQLRRLFV